MYRCVARSVSEFIWHFAVNYVSRGYFFYVRGEIPAHKNPVAIDERIIEKYGIAISKWTRARRKKQGAASVQYLRCRHQFAILATHGEHRLFQDEANAIRDIRRVPFKLGGYSVSFREDVGRTSVRIAKEQFLQLREYLFTRARCASVEEMIGEFHAFSFPPFAPVRRQLFTLLRDINQLRKIAGLESIPIAAVLPRYGQHENHDRKTVPLLKTAE